MTCLEECHINNTQTHSKYQITDTIKKLWFPVLYLITKDKGNDAKHFGHKAVCNFFRLFEEGRYVNQ